MPFGIAAGTVNVSNAPITPASGQVAGAGNNTILTPDSGKHLRIFYASYNPFAAVQAAFRFGPAGTLWLVNSVVANSVIAKEFGPTRLLEGAVDESLILNLSDAVATNWTVFYEEA